jgi:hypothetical protein
MRARQRPLGRREAYLLRQKRVVQRAAKRAEKATIPAFRAHPTPMRLVGIPPLNPDITRKQAHRAAFAAGIAKAETIGARWQDRGEVRWQPFAYRPGVFRPGDRISHAKFGRGTIQTVDEVRLLIMFDDRAVGQKRIISSFVTRT